MPIYMVVYIGKNIYIGWIKIKCLYMQAFCCCCFNKWKGERMEWKKGDYPLHLFGGSLIQICVNTRYCEKKKEEGKKEGKKGC